MSIQYIGEGLLMTPAYNTKGVPEIPGYFKPNLKSD